MSVVIASAPPSSSTGGAELSQLTVDGADSDSPAVVQDQGRSVRTCSIGVQTESEPTLINTTLPLWALSLGSSFRSPNFPFHDLLSPRGIPIDLEFKQTQTQRLRQNALLQRESAAEEKPFVNLFDEAPKQVVIDPKEKGSRQVPFAPLPVVESVLLNSSPKLYQIITCMQAYDQTSLEELRLMDIALEPATATVYHAFSSSSSSGSSNFSLVTSSGPAAPVVAATATPRTMNPFPLYNDAIQVILRYLDTKDLVTSARLSKQWYRALDTAQALEVTSTAMPSKLAAMPANSVIARRITNVTGLNEAIRLSLNSAFQGFSIAPHLGMLLPNLKTLEIIEHEGIEKDSFRLSCSVSSSRHTLTVTRSFSPFLT